MQQFLIETFCGRAFSSDEIKQIHEIVDSCRGISRTELASTVCELFDWKRPTGKLKTVECRQFLEHLDEQGVIELPGRKAGRVKGKLAGVKITVKSEMPGPICASVREISPIGLLRVTTKDQRLLWYEYIHRYHYLGYQQPFGAQLRYFIASGKQQDVIVGCFQFSSPAWKMAPRDQWIGWGDDKRRVNLQKVINNSRFLILPWVKVKNLASTALALACRTVAGDWKIQYGYRPVLMETLVDKSRFTGACYKAANWLHIGTTTGRGRMDRDHLRQGYCLKDIYLYPLSSRFRETLLQQEGMQWD